MRASAVINRIQFQKGLCLQGFLAQYGQESQCRVALRKLRWPSGFICPHCGSTRHWMLSRPLIRCAQCRRETSLTAGTLFHCTKLPLTTWFLAIYFVTQTKTGLSGPELKRHLGINEKTAWLILHKLMEAMRQHEERRVLSGSVELDDAYLGGHLYGGKDGRGSQNKRPFILAVQTTPSDGVSYACAHPLPSFHKAHVHAWAIQHLRPGTVVTTDGFRCFRGVAQAGCTHVAMPGLSRVRPTKAHFYWVNTILANLKTGLAGVRHRTVDKYMARFLAQFQFRFNHRFDLSCIARRLIEIAACTLSCPRPALTSVVTHG